MKIGFGSDHAGFELKCVLIEHLKDKGYDCIDYGSFNKDRADYPDYGRLVGEKVASGEADKGVLVCGTGIGISIAANKVRSVRAAVCSEPLSAGMAVRHNDANIIAVGARVVGEDMAKMIVDEFFKSTFEGGRHADRVKKLMSIEN